MSMPSELEKSTAYIDSDPITPDSSSDDEGYVLDAHKLGANSTLKTTSDGSIILRPQPSDSPGDPLNWSQWKKHILLLVISATAFLPDYGGAAGAVALIPQAVDWNMTQEGVLQALIGNVFMIGAGGLISVAFMAYFGRLPVLFWFTFCALWSAAFCAGAANFTQYQAARVLNGFFSTVAQGGGLVFINDIFFVHEHARKINVWSFFIILSPYLGPMFTGFIIAASTWQWAFALYVLMTGLCLTAVICFGQETYYDRRIAPESQPLRKSHLLRVVGIEQYRTHLVGNTFSQAMMRPVRAICKPVVFISTVYYTLIFAWVVGINTTLSIFLQPLYGFGPRQIGFFYFTPIVAVILGEACGHWLHDSIASVCMRRNGGRLEAEARLWVTYIATPFMVAGLVLLGFALQHGYPYMLAALGWGLYVFGIMLATVGINAYALDAYPEAAGEVSAWLNFARTTGGIFVTEWQVPWAAAVGPVAALGTQAGITAGAFLLVVLLQVVGKRLRHYGGRLDFRTN
ncbi:hypothetical protein MMC17_009478 [Xylographa soralifera]|nr:hypothetical protein [Xylographa soralifera]